MFEMGHEGVKSENRHPHQLLDTQDNKFKKIVV